MSWCLSDEMLAGNKVKVIILANVGTVVCFRTGSPADEARLLPIFSPFIEHGEIGNLEPFTFYIKVTAVSSQPPFSGVTRVLGTEEEDEPVYGVIH